MLENSLLESQGRRKTRKPATVVVSAIVHIVAVAVLVLIPLLQTHAIVIPPVDMALCRERTYVKAFQCSLNRLRPGDNRQVMRVSSHLQRLFRRRSRALSTRRLYRMVCLSPDRVAQPVFYLSSDQARVARKGLQNQNRRRLSRFLRLHRQLSIAARYGKADLSRKRT